MRGIVALLLVVMPASVLAITPGELSAIRKSLKPGQVAEVERATGGLEQLPLLEADITLDFHTRTVSGTASLDWRNDTGRSVTVLPVRFASNSGHKKPPHAGWSHVTVTMPGASAVQAKVRRQSATISLVTLPLPLGPGERVVVHGDLEGKLARIDSGGTDPVTASMSALMSGQGLGKPQADGEQYGTFACGDDICTLTGFTPEVPAYFDGHFDTDEGSGIGDATYSVPENAVFSVTAERGINVVATGVETGRTSDGTKTRRSYAMAATREVGVIASPGFEFSEMEFGGVTVRSYARPADAAAGRAALDSAVSALNVLSMALGEYPWSFLNVAESALTGGAGGVELPGLALGASGFYQPGGGMLAMLGAGDLSKGILDFITRHEVAHQWWALQVGSHSQIHPYIDEPLAQWCALLTVRQSQGDEAAELVKAMQIAANFQALSMMGVADGVVARPAGEFGSMIEYAGLVYGKAPLFYEAAVKLVGLDNVTAALREIVSQKKFQRVVPEELVAALVRHAGAQGPEMRALWHRWFEEVHGTEDVGTLDVNGLGSMLGLGGGLSDEDTAAAMKQIEDLMKQMGDKP